MSGPVALVTGASGGIGGAVASRLARAGCRVLAHYRSAAGRAGDLVRHLPGEGHAALQADLSRSDEVADLADRAVGQAGRVDILVNNAGLYEEHPLPETGLDAWREIWRRTLDTNLLGPADLCYCLGRHMIGQGGGRIINISSRGAFRGEPDAPAYGASKAGLNALSQSLARSLAPHGVGVFVVAPGFVETEMAAELLSGPQGDDIRSQSPLGRVGRVDEIAALVEFLALGEADYLTGCVVDANGASYLRT